jgi:hypothetical protein
LVRIAVLYWARFQTEFYLTSPEMVMIMHYLICDKGANDTRTTYDKDEIYPPSELFTIAA